MGDIATAYRRALRSLLSPGVLWHLCWPAVLSFLAWGCALYYGWTPAADGLRSWMEALPWVGAWIGNGWVGTALGSALKLFLLLLSIPLVFLLTVLLVALFAVPLILDRVARLEYADLEMRGGGTLLGSAFNVLKALVLFALAALICMPLLFVPVVGFMTLLLLSAWFNVRCFRYDALMNHADSAEMRELPAKHRWALFGVGIVGSLCGFVPILNLLAPIISGLAFIHFLLAALRRQRLNQ